MKKAWIVLIISALTDAFLLVAGGVTSAMAATGVISMPSKPVVLINLLFGWMAFARTIQQALKATPETSAALMGGRSIVDTRVLERTP